jgi:hypothetical protein
MISFKEYLQEDIITSKRQSIVHFQDMKPLEALQFLRKIKSELIGKLDNIPITLKVDGFAARFGKDNKGKFFFETGKSGPIQSDKAFSSYTQAKNGNEVMMQRAVHYDDVFDVIKDSSLWHDMPNDVKLNCEIMYNPMASEENNELTFVSVKYDKKKLGKIMTIVPISVSYSSSGENHPYSDKIVSDIISKSSADIKVVSPKLKNLSLDISAQLEPLAMFDEDAERVVKSLKHADKEKKEEYKVMLNAIKAEVADIIMNYPIAGRDKFGSEIEGYVVELDGKLYKITTSKFKQQKRDDKLAYKKNNT